jgi:hypothetical protein
LEPFSFFEVPDRGLKGVDFPLLDGLKGLDFPLLDGLKGLDFPFLDGVM